MDRIDSIELYTEIIKENIEYDILLERNSYDREGIDGIVDLLVETVCSTRPTIRVGQEEIPTEVVKSRLLKLDEGHIEYVLESLRSNTTKVSNIRAYLLTSLYRAPTTMSQHYTALVSHDMAKGFGGS